MCNLWPFLVRLLLMCFALSSQIFHVGATNNTSPCGPVPFPFGPSGMAMSGFEVACINNSHNYHFGVNKSNTPHLFLKMNGDEYLIESISLQGQMRILNGLIYRQCYNETIEPNTTFPGSLNLEGTPYTVSKDYTTLVAVGCDDMIIIKGMNDRVSSLNSRSGCATFCYNLNNIIDGYCSGLGCCQASLPVGLKSFYLQVVRIPNMTMEDRLSNCSSAFFAAREDFSFNTLNFEENKYFGGATYTVVLDWAIGDQSCSEAHKDPYYACKNNSECYDSPTGVGYFCNCSQGYQGNPYVLDGCKDIDECLEPETNPCIEVKQCNNQPGSVTCTCPSGMSGDGRKDGSGCTADIDECRYPEANPCVRIAKCSNNTGSVTCDCPTDMSGDGKKDGSGCKKAFPVNITLGTCLILVFLLSMASLYLYWFLQKRKLIKMRSEYFKQNGGWILRQRLASEGVDSTSRIFTIEELQKATDNYNENRILGRGGYGTVYKGILSDRRVVAIKRSRLVDDSQVEQFVNEITILSQVNHRNVVKLLGCCLETEVPLLVYEFISNGTLFEHIHSHGPLSWEDRLRISTETARAIAYLHSAAAFPIIHRDIKSSNILLDEKFTAKVSDFGASRSVPFDQTHVTTLVQGTLGYLDPEYFYTSQLTEKSDVYSFGVVLAELLTRKKPIAFDRSEDSRNLATYFVTLFDEGQLVHLLDPHVLEEARLDETHLVANLAKRCLNVKAQDRPNMKEVAFELEGLRRLGKKNSSQENHEDNE